MKLSTVIAIVYVVAALGGIAWFMEWTYARSQDHHWPKFRRHGFTLDDLVLSVLFGMTMLVFNAAMHALDIAKVSKAPWVDFAGTTLILVTAVLYVFWQRKNRSMRHAMRRTIVFFAPMLAAMAIDQYLDKAARVIAHIGL